MKALTITLNPSLDKTYRLDSALLMRGATNFITEITSVAGGSGVNVSNALVSLGVDTDTFVVTGGVAGENYKAYMHPSLKPIYYDIEGMTRTNHKIKAGETTTDLLEPSPYLEFAEIAEVFDAIAGIIGKYDIVAFSGTMPNGVDALIVKNIVKLCPEKFYLDLNGEFLKAGLECKPFFIKPSQSEVIQLGFGNAEETLVNLSESGGVTRVTATLGNQGAMYVRRGEIYKAFYQGDPLKIESTAGCGDSFVAACIYNHSLRDMHEIVSYAVACATANAVIGRNGRLDLKTVEDILPKITVKKA